MTAEEKRLYDDAMAFINMQVKAVKMMHKDFKTLQVANIGRLNKPESVQIFNIIKLCEIVNLPFTRRDWEGNATCNSDWDEVYFIYKGIKFFGLEDKEDERQ